MDNPPNEEQDNVVNILQQDQNDTTWHWYKIINGVDQDLEQAEASTIFNMLQTDV